MNDRRDDDEPASPSTDDDRGPRRRGLDDEGSIEHTEDDEVDVAAAADSFEPAQDDTNAPETGDETVRGADVPSPAENPIGWFLNTRNGSVLLFKDIVSSVAIVAAIGLVLFAISGVWPPLVAIESGSMDPHMQKGDLVFLMENERLTSSDAVAAGVVTHEVGQESGYTKFGDHGDVIVFRPNGQQRTPIIHRAHLYVEEGENWYDRADADHVGADSCTELTNCPAPHDGFVTKGDNPRTNPQYDQVDRYQLVKPEWIEGTAEVRVPYLGCIRLEFSGTASCRV